MGGIKNETTNEKTIEEMSKEFAHHVILDFIEYVDTYTDLYSTLIKYDMDFINDGILFNEQKKLTVFDTI